MMAFIAIFHLVVFLIKVGLLAAVYSSVPIAIIYVIRRQQVRSFTLTALLVYVAVYIGLLVYSGSFWGNRGFYDTAELPVAYGTTITCSDGHFTYIQIGSEQHLVGSFALHDGKIFAEDRLTTSADSVREGMFLIFNPATKELRQFVNKDEYEKFASRNNYPRTTDFREFFDHYNDYWNGWRRWLLP